MLKRNVPAVVRVPYFVVATDPENYYSTLLVQYTPYRSELELLQGCDTAKEAFLGNEQQLKQMSDHMEVHYERDRQLANAWNQVHALNILEEAVPVEMEDEEEEVPGVEMDEEQLK